MPKPSPALRLVDVSEESIARARAELGPEVSLARVLERAREIDQPPAPASAPATSPRRGRGAATAAKKGPIRRAAGRTSSRVLAEVPGVGPQTSELFLSFAGATLGTVILVQLLGARGSRAVTSIVDGVATGVRKLADPADPILTPPGGTDAP